MVTRTTLCTAHTDDREKRGDKSYTRRTANGNAIDLDKGIFLPNAPLDAVRLSEWAANMLQMQKDILEVATKLQKKRDLRRQIEKKTHLRNE